MSITATDRGTGTHNSSSTTFTLSPSGNFAAGSWAVLSVAVDNAESDGLAHTTFTVTDSLGNTWHRRLRAADQPTAASNGAVEGAIFTTNQDGGTLTTGTTITVTLGVNTTAKAWTLVEAIPSGGSMYFIASHYVKQASTATPTITSYSIANGDLILGALFYENGTATITGDGDTTNGNWSSQQTNKVGVGTGGMGISTQQKIVSATATQTYNPTISSAVDSVIGWVQLSETAPVGIYATDRGVGKHNVSSTTATLSPSSNCLAGALVCLVVAVDNSHTNGDPQATFTVTDSLGNTWTRAISPIYDPGAASAGVEGGVFVTDQSAGALTTSTTITITLGTAATAKAWVLVEVGDYQSRRLAVRGGTSGTGATGTTPSITTSTIPLGALVLAGVWYENGLTVGVAQDNDSTSGQWLTQQFSVVGPGTSGVGVACQCKAVTAPATQSYDVTLGSSSDYVPGWIAIDAQVTRDAIGCGIIPWARVQP